MNHSRSASHYLNRRGGHLKVGSEHSSHQKSSADGGGRLLLSSRHSRSSSSCSSRHSRLGLGKSRHTQQQQHLRGSSTSFHKLHANNSNSSSSHHSTRSSAKPPAITMGYSWNDSLHSYDTYSFDDDYSYYNRNSSHNVKRITLLPPAPEDDLQDTPVASSPSSAFLPPASSSSSCCSSSRFPKKAPPLAVTPPPSPIMVELSPGVSARLRGAQETWDCIEQDFYMPAVCYGCGLQILGIQDASFILCPHCRVVSPVEGSLTGLRGGVALGFTMDDLFAWQATILQQRRVQQQQQQEQRRRVQQHYHHGRDCRGSSGLGGSNIIDDDDCSIPDDQSMAY